MKGSLPYFQNVSAVPKIPPKKFWFLHLEKLRYEPFLWTDDLWSCESESAGGGWIGNTDRETDKVRIIYDVNTERRSHKSCLHLCSILVRSPDDDVSTRSQTSGAICKLKRNSLYYDPHGASPMEQSFRTMYGRRRLTMTSPWHDDVHAKSSHRYAHHRMW